ncbi:hypothetical protein WI73_04115 [Burkholderia ubonensis]|uniref:hypothetical protein n=1 Tax=Burkholderia ubonensis TaxID=101571 RepID=UPI00075E9466|nr:hypothetical protein [Burkholderia ubonensis]KVC60420.1 hypothetical protein WI73_04115 [Burkholderia ubonensis]
MDYLRHIDKIVEDSFGLWITGLFSAISGHMPGISFERHRDTFFQIVEHLLKTGKIKFIAPGADCYVSPERPNPRYTIDNHDAQWHAPPREIVSYLRDKWPTTATHEDDLVLLDYFYGIPCVICVRDDGTMTAS